MKQLAVLLGLVAIFASAGIATPLVPKDNSHYVEGVNRYIWMTGDDGTTELVDLQEPIGTEVQTRAGTDNQYWLFTRSNPTTPQRILQGNVNSVTNSNYAVRNPLKVVVHGWSGSLSSELNRIITSALLAADDVNVIVVDWSTVASANYVTAAANTPVVGQAIGKFVVWLVGATRASWDNVHLIGFSLGAHAVGSAGVVANGLPRRVTGLDAAGPGWQTNVRNNTISITAGRYVELIHTDIAVMGLLLPTGHVSFYPNGGTMQPGCNSNQCSHSRAWKLFASSVRTNHFIGRRCADLNEAVNNLCTGSDTARMGNSVLNKQGAGIATPLVPKDNNHYVEGVSRYIWMTGDDGTTELVDLQEPIGTEVQTRAGRYNQYWLFTRSNPTTPQRILQGNVNSVTNSNYATRNPLKVVVHGWTGSLSSESNRLITSALLAAGDVNVIVVDWSTVAAANYVTAAANTPEVGKAIGNFVVWLVGATRASWDNVHLIGFSLGAHAVGNAGVVANGRPRRVTGLDAAGPGWQTNVNKNTISRNAGRYVELIHTDATTMGLLYPTGHVSFYPNGGNMQPGCNSNQCSHSRAWELFASSVRTNHFVGRRCADLNQAVNNQCTGSNTARMGNSILNKQGTGIYGLRTNSVWPF